MRSTLTKFVLLVMATFVVGSRAAATNEHWAFVPPKAPGIPKVKDARWVKTGIDPFILAKLEGAGLRPTLPADKRTLLRRATFDLTGLPPTSDDVESFLADNSANAFARVVDRLLASPHYGERWGRRWLDIARYADTKGYVYDREERFFVHAWTYRDWVVRAFNNDLPYDRFLKLQIAADQIAAADSPDLAAMGFVTGGRRFIGVTREIIDDRIDTVMRGTMALTVACARCHDHKYDPIPTRDYYSLYGVFDAGTDRLVSLGPEPVDEEYLKRVAKYRDTMKTRREEASAKLRARVADYLAAQLELQKYPEEGFDQLFAADDILPGSVRRWRDFLNRNQRTIDPIFAPWHALSKPEPEAYDVTKLNPIVAREFATPPKNLRAAAERYGKIFTQAATNAVGFEAQTAFLQDPRSPTSIPDTDIISNESYFSTAACEELWRLKSEIDRWVIRAKSPLPYALAVMDREPERDPRVFIRGNPARPGEEVKRQFPAVLAGAKRKPFEHGSGRLELARAIASADNPLTARVMVNRIWQGHFGAGLVRTPSDFGLRAEAPSHPQLLDWLAVEFIQSGWSMKAIHRKIMLSATYQQSSLAEPPAHDPENRMLSSYPRVRLDFEAMRDAMLASSGELDATIGGKASELFSTANKRRTIYGLVDRQFLPATFRVFDFANPDIHVGTRHDTTVPQQALFLLNNAFSAERARVLAKRTTNRFAMTEDRVRHIYERALQRAPTQNEITMGARFIAEAERYPPPAKPKLVETGWQYGWGEYDAKEKRLKKFQALPHFTGKAWQGAANFPDEKHGWAQLTADGGHPGNDLAHAVVRRWVAPTNGLVAIAGELKHEHAAGDGVHALIVSSRHGELKAATAHHSKQSMALESMAVEAGDTIDFIVDVLKELNTDQFLWAPTISLGEKTWDAKKEFSGPTPDYIEPLQPWAQYAQAILLANEFSFID